MAQQEQQQSRRRFLKIAGGVLFTTAALGGGLITCGARQPMVKMPATQYRGANEMQKKILVGYASKCGSTAEIAEVIGQVLNAQGFAVDVQPIKQVTDVSAYHAVVLGSAVRMGGWLGDAKKFVKTHQAVLRAKPTAYFTVCLSLKDDTPEKRQEAAKYDAAARALVEPKDAGFFAGKMDYRTLSFFDRLISSKMVKAPEGDFRNWDAIRAWAANLQAVLA